MEVATRIVDDPPARPREKNGVFPHPAKATLDPAFRRQLFEVYEEAIVLGARWNTAPIGARESEEWFIGLPEHLGRCISGIAQLTRAKQPDAKSLRAVYEAVIMLKGASKGKVTWREGGPTAPVVAAWVLEIEGGLDRIIAGLRELVIQVGPHRES